MAFKVENPFLMVTAPRSCVFVHALQNSSGSSVRTKRTGTPSTVASSSLLSTKLQTPYRQTTPDESERERESFNSRSASWSEVKYAGSTIFVSHQSLLISNNDLSKLRVYQDKSLNEGRARGPQLRTIV